MNKFLKKLASDLSNTEKELSYLMMEREKLSKQVAALTESINVRMIILERLREKKNATMSEITWLKVL